MTHKEKIIATAYTGIMFVDGSELGEVYAYEEEKLGHGVIDIMHADKEFQQKLRNAVREDFLAMISKDDKLIDKACEWLEKNAVKYIGLLFSSHIRDEDGSERVEVRGSVNMKLYDDFRKAMKENDH